jgi:glycerol-3-phosphate dehydrogenase
MTFAFAENAAKNGVKFQFDSEVTDIQKIDGGWKVCTVKGDLEAKVVINAAGVYSDKLHNMVSDETMTITPRRGDYFLLDRTTEGFVKHTIFQLPGKLGKGVLVAPTIHGNTIVGPTAVDIEDKDDTSTTQAGLDDVRSRSGMAVKDLPLKQTITNFAGLRAHENRHEFFIGQIAPGFVDCAAIESPGLSSAPAIGVMVAEIVDGILNLESDPNFDPCRKGILNPKNLSFDDRSALIKEKPAYGTVICRCETITEGEIIDAIHRVPGARSLDGVKRRTRAGMGRCQGGFCSPRVMEILSRELGIPMDAVTKSGGASKLIMGTNKDSV